MDIDLLTRLYADHVNDLARRYAEVLTASAYDGVVIHSGSLKTRTDFDDQFWPLRPTPHFQHWVPIAQPDCAILFVVGKTPTLVWTRANSIWETPAQPETEHFTASFAIERPDSADKVRALIPAGRMAFIGEDRARAASWGFDASLVNPEEVVGRLDRLRTTKTAYEVLCLAEANRRAAVGHEALRRAFAASDRSELDLHLLYLGATGQDDPETPYKNIVALGESAAVLHHIDYRKRPTSRAAESLLVDAGATYQGYCSDITRTWWKGTGATLSAFAGLVEGVEAMQRRLCEAVRLGIGYETLHEESHRGVAAILRSIGVIQGSEEEAIAAGVTRAFYPHGLGHSLGLQCHDVGCALVRPKPENPYLRNTSTITPGQTFTVEPGVYFIDGLLTPLREGEHAKLVDFALIDALRPLGGVRIEDDIVVLPEGSNSAARNLTREHLPVGGADASAPAPRASAAT